MDSKRSAVRVETIDLSEVGRRIDNYLLSRLKDAPRSLVYKLLRSGQVRVNGGRVKPDYRLATADEVRIPPLTVVAAPGEPATIPSRRLAALADAILYEDDAFLIIDKPAGLASHGGSGLRYGAIEAARRLRPQLPRLDLAHRLDRDTSGCLVLCKGLAALTEFHAALRAGAVDKRYRALLCGHLPPDLTRIEAALRVGRDAAGERFSTTAADGRIAQTDILSARTVGAHTLAEFKLVTGRMHQIRAHALHIGHPLAGDPRYGEAACNARLTKLGLGRLFLHAESIVFSACGRTVEVTAALPGDLAAVLERVAAA